MQINWYGQSCFQIEAKQGKDKVKIIIDPFNKELGINLPKLKADILLISHDHYDHNNVDIVSGASEDGKAPLLITGPGEYESKEVFVHGIEGYHDDKKGGERGKVTIYIIKVEDMTICHLSDIGQGELTEEQISEIGDVDILLIPVGGVYTIDAGTATKIMSQIEPRITIPMHYNIPGIKEKLDSVDSFLKELGIDKVEPEEKLKIQKSDLSADEAKIIVLKP